MALRNRELHDRNDDDVKSEHAHNGVYAPSGNDRIHLQARREPARAQGQTTFRVPPHPLPFPPSPAAKRPLKSGGPRVSPPRENFLKPRSL